METLDAIQDQGISEVSASGKPCSGQRGNCHGGRLFCKKYSVNFYTENLDKANSNPGRYKAHPELILGGTFIRYRMKGSPEYQLLESLVAANVVTAIAVNYFVK